MLAHRANKWFTNARMAVRASQRSSSSPRAPPTPGRSPISRTILSASTESGQKRGIHGLQPGDQDVPRAHNFGCHTSLHEEEQLSSPSRIREGALLLSSWMFFTPRKKPCSAAEGDSFVQNSSSPVVARCCSTFQRKAVGRGESLTFHPTHKQVGWGGCTRGV